MSYFIGSSFSDGMAVKKIPGNDSISKSEKGYPQLRYDHAK